MSSQAAEQNILTAVIKAAPGVLRKFSSQPSGIGGTVYAQLHDLSAVPAEGAVPLISLVANGMAPLDFDHDGWLFNNGIVFVVSTTQFTYTPPPDYPGYGTAFYAQYD